jgi:hypothetical protein
MSARGEVGCGEGGLALSSRTFPAHQARSIFFDEVAVGAIISDRPPHRSARALIRHAAPISDEWRRSGQGARDGAHEVEEAIVRPA